MLKLIKINLLLLPCFLTAGIIALAQQKEHLNLDECYTLAEKNYPLVKQRELLALSKTYSVDNVSKDFLPQVSINGQATYQSDVTQIPISFPGVDIPTLSKDQYKLYGEISQPLTAMITTSHQKELQEVNSDLQEDNLDVDLYKLKDRVNQLYFGILLIGEQYRQNELRKKDIQNGIDRINVAVENGVDYGNNVDKLKAELLNADQQSIELSSSRKAYILMLGQFLNREIGDSTIFDRPLTPSISDKINRPELKVYENQGLSDDIQSKILRSKNIPRVDLFFQGGVGRPSPVNMLSKDMSPYYIGGIRLNWSISSFYTYGHDQQLLDIDRSMNEARRETFLFNTNFTLKQQNQDIEKLQELIQSDDKIVDLRTSIKNTADTQLNNGAISVNDYLSDINAEEQARQNRSLHEVQLLMAYYDYRNTAGN